MSDYKPNSHRFKEEQAKESVERQKKDKIITGTANIKKKNELGKIASTIITEDVKNVKSYIICDVLIPAISNTILDIIVGSANMIFGGKAKTGKSGTNAGYISYGSAYGGVRNQVSRVSETPRQKSNFSYDDIVLKDCSRGEAEQVLDRMRESIDVYGCASIADLYDFVGISHSYTDNKYGWTNLQTARVVRVRDGYAFELPQAKPLDK